MKLKGLFRRKSTGVYFFQPPQVKGTRQAAVSLRTTDEAVAIERYLVAAQNARALVKPAALGLEVGRFHAAKTRSGRHTPESTRSSEYVLGIMVERLGEGRNVGGISTADLEKWLRSIEGRVAPSSVRTYFARVSSFFAWATREGLCAANPVAGLELPKTVNSRAERYCTKEEREKILAACPPERDDLAMILHLGFFAGLRLQEIIEARPEWVDLASGTLTVQNTPTFQTKDRRHRIIRMSSRLAAFLAAHGLRGPYLLRPDKKPGQKVGGARGGQPRRYRYDPKRPFKKLVGQVGLPWVTFHTMRHTFATLHAVAGTPLTTIARELGDDERTAYHNYVGHSRHTAHADAID